MIEPKIDVNVSTESGLFFQKDVSWRGVGSFSGPAKTTPYNDFEMHGGVPESDRDIAEIYALLSPVDLEAYRSGESSKALREIEDQSDTTGDNEITVLFIEYSQTLNINQQDMQTLVDIQLQFADVVTYPIQPTLIEAISPFIDEDHELDNSPMTPYTRSMESFFEVIDGGDVPVFATIPPVVFDDRGREIMSYFEEKGLTSFAIDFRGFKPTTDRLYSQIEDMFVDLGTRRQAESRLFYALNYKPYHVSSARDIHPSEALKLAGSGFDILGGTYAYRGGGGGGPSDNIKIFNPTSFGFQEVPKTEIETNWPVNSTISPSKLASVGENQQRGLRRLVNAEQLSIAFKKIRAATRDGKIAGLFEGKVGLPDPDSNQMNELSNSYVDAVGPNVTSDY